MNKKMMVAVQLIVGWATAVAAAEPSDWNWEAGEGVSYRESSVLTTEFSLSFDSRYMTYGVIDGKDPILTPSATMTFFETLSVGVEAIFDITKGNGKRGGYGNRAGKYTTLDAIVGLSHDVDLGERLGTLSVGVSYLYEYLPRRGGEVGDTQYVTADFSLGDLWLEPVLVVERDLMADDGTYVSFEIGHTFALTWALSLRPALGQGFGNSQRTFGYFGALEKVDGFDHGGLMDTTLRLELAYALSDALTLGLSVAYYDYLFDDALREAAAARNGEWGAGEDKTWNVVVGLSVTATF